MPYFTISIVGGRGVGVVDMLVIVVVLIAVFTVSDVFIVK